MADIDDRWYRTGPGRKAQAGQRATARASGGRPAGATRTESSAYRAFKRKLDAENFLTELSSPA